MLHDIKDEWVQRYVPFIGLTVAIPFALAVGSRSFGYVAAVLVLSAFSAAWVHFGYTPPEKAEGRPVRAIVYYTVLLALIAALVTLSPFFGFFGFTGYLHIAPLPRRLWPPAIVLTAMLMATTQVGGVGNLHGGGLLAYGGLVLVNVVIAGMLTLQGLAEETRGRERARTIDQLAEANRRLHETMEENVGLHAQLVAQAREAGILDERQRMAGEIHDTLAQGLTGIVTQLEAAERAEHDPERRQRHLALARRLARESLTEARRSVQALRPGPLAEAHLPDAIRDLAEQWSQTSGVPVRLEVTGEPVPLPPALDVVLFRTAQEALANIAKHAGASQAGVTLSYTHEVVVLDVLDNGLGFTAPSEPSAPSETTNGGGYGLTAMRQRLRQVGGSLEIESTPTEGTAISASVPALQSETPVHTNPKAPTHPEPKAPVHPEPKAPEDTKPEAAVQTRPEAPVHAEPETSQHADTGTAVGRSPGENEA